MTTTAGRSSSLHRRHMLVRVARCGRSCGTTIGTPAPEPVAIIDRERVTWDYEMITKILWGCLIGVIVMVALVIYVSAASPDDEYWRDYRRDSEVQACVERWTPALRDECLRQLREK